MIGFVAAVAVAAFAGTVLCYAKTKRMRKDSYIYYQWCQYYYEQTRQLRFEQLEESQDSTSDFEPFDPAHVPEDAAPVPDF